jgi:DNA-binding MurR/RpiR family transcriptional regulator
MAGVLARIRSVHDTLPDAERRVAEYVLANVERAPSHSVHELAAEAGVSVASVSRFVRRAGFAHFRVFKLELARETAATVSQLFRAITPRDTDREIVRKVFLGNIQSLEDTLGLLEVPDLVRAAKAICAARRLVFLGVGGSGAVARDSALRFSYLDFQAEAYVEGSEILLQALRVGKGDVVLAISHSGRSTITVEGLTIARTRLATTIGVSNYRSSPIHDASDLFFCTAFPESRVKVAALSSRVAQLCLLDALYLVVAHHKEHHWDVEQVNALTERVLRLPVRGRKR